MFVAAVPSVRAGVLGVALLMATPSVADDRPQPGRYAVIVKITNSMMPNPDVRTREDCITAGEFTDGPDNFIAQVQNQQDCSVSDYDMAGGRITLQMECTIPGGGRAVVAGDGEYSAQSFSMVNNMTMNMAGMEMKMSTTMSGERIGDC